MVLILQDSELDQKVSKYRPEDKNNLILNSQYSLLIIVQSSASNNLYVSAHVCVVSLRYSNNLLYIV